MSDPVFVISTGMVTAVGLSAPETAASVRAGTMRITETDLRDKHFDRFTIAEVPEDGLPPLSPALRGTSDLTAREMRLLRLATNALRECVAPVGNLGRPLALCLALPEMETRRSLNGPLFLNRLADQSGGMFDPAASDAS